MLRERQILQEISQIDIRTEPKKYSQQVLQIICEKLNFTFGSIILVNEEGVGSMFAAYNLPETYPALVESKETPVLSSPSGIAVAKGKIVVVNNIPREPRLKPWFSILKELGIETIIWIPLFSGGKVFGTYILYDRRKRYFLKGQKNTLNLLSSIFSLAIISNEYIDTIHLESRKLELENRARRQVEIQLRESNQRLEKADKAKSQFLANISHELRTPLNAILGFSDLMLDDEEDESKKELLTFVRSAGEKLLSAINDILDFSKLEESKLEIESEVFSLEKLVNLLEDTFAHKAAEQNLDLIVEVEGVLPPFVLGDKSRVKQVLFNILGNAFKFTRMGTIKVNCLYKEDCAWFEISDTGIGISQEKQANIFSAFTQADGSSTRAYGGTGLGLTIAGELVTLMSGAISMESEEGKGSCFTIMIPLPQSPPPEKTRQGNIES